MRSVILFYAAIDSLLQAGGNIGKHLIPRLLETKHLTVTALTRGNYTAPDPRIRVLTVDYEDISQLTSALKDQHALLSLVPGGQAKWASQKLLIDAAVAAHVQLFVPSEFVANILAPQFAIFPPAVVGDKIELRKYLEERAGAGDITWTALNGGPFFDMCESSMRFYCAVSYPG